MTEQNPEPTPEEPTPDTDETEAPEELLHEAPADRAEDESKGYAVFDRRVAQYVTGVFPNKSEATKRAKADNLAVVRV